MIEISKLVAHPKNANGMGKGVMEKLRRQIGRTGRYEPLMVRRHPEREGFYEMINGHHRKLVLEQLGHREAACLVWELDDAEALMLLATVNRLSGKDAAGKRVELLEALAEEVGLEGMTGCLPEDGETLKRLLEAEAGPVVMGEAPRLSEMEEAFTVFLKSEEKGRLVRALRETDRDLGRALMKWLEGNAKHETRNAKRVETRRGEAHEGARRRH